MEVSNKTSFLLVAFCWHMKHGYGKDTEINPGQTIDVPGPYLGEMGGGSCTLVVPGKIACQETPDDENGFQVSEGNQLNLKSNDFGITVRHFSEERIIID